MASNNNHNNHINTGKIWTKEEEELLAKLYNIDKINLIEISVIHQRAPGGIIARLLKNKIVVDKKEIRGYDEYLNSENSNNSDNSDNIDNVKTKIGLLNSKPSKLAKISKINYKINDEKNDEIILINNNEYILNDNTIYEIKKVKSNIYGYYDLETNTVQVLKSNFKKIISYLNSKSDLVLNILWAGSDLDKIKKYYPKFNFTDISIVQLAQVEPVPVQVNYNICIINNYLSYLENNINDEINKIISLLNVNGDIIILDNKKYYSEINKSIIKYNLKIIDDQENFTNKLFFSQLIKRHVIKKMNTMVLEAETTGFPASEDPKELDKFNNARLIELGYRIYDSTGKKIKEYVSLVKPDNFIISNTYIHGISQQDAISNGKSILAVLNELSTDLDTIDVFVCHHISFDMNIILSESHRANMQDLVKKIESKEKLCTVMCI